MRREVLLVMCMFLFSACTPPVQSTNSAQPYVEISPDRTLIWQIGTSTQLRALLRDEQGNAASNQPGFTWISSNASTVSVDGNGVVTANADGEAIITATGGDYLATARVVVNTGVLVVSGQVRYEDQYYSTSGVTGQRVYKAVRHALLDLVDSNNTVLQTVVTDALGNYQIGLTSNGPYTLRVITQSAPTLAASIEVNDVSGNLYAASQVLDPLDPATANIDISIDSGLAPAFNILDIYTAASEFLSAYTSATQAPLAVFWETGNSRGTYFCTSLDATYCPAGGGVYVLSAASASGDHDEFDDDVLWHEYSHYVAHTLSRDDSPGGCHVLTSNDLDLRLAWSEGWGDYFPAIMKSWLLADSQRATILSIPDTTPVSVYVDTYGSYAGIALDIATPGGAPYFYAGSEISISKVLWDLSSQFGFAALWDVMQYHMPTSATPINSEALWDGWLSRHAPDNTALATLQGIFGARQMFYQQDNFEDDTTRNAARSIAVGGNETHYLYFTSGGKDTDVVALDAVAGTSYTVQTYDLRNGADTYLKVVDSGGTLVVDNDDANPNAYSSFDSVCGVTRVKNNSTALSSSVTFTVATTGTFYIEVSSTPDLAPYLSAGRYGGYSLRVVQN